MGEPPQEDAPKTTPHTTLTTPPGVLASARLSGKRPGWSRSTWHHICWWGSWVLIGVVFVSVWTGALQNNQLFHVGPLLVQTWVADNLLFGLVFVCWFFVLLTLPTAPPGQTRVRRALRVAGRTLAGLLAAAVTLIAGLYAPWLALFFGGTPYRVLSPASPGGCRLVVSVTRDATFERVGRSDGIFLLTIPGSVKVRKTGHGWYLPGSIDPFRDHAWSLQWEGRVGHLTVNSTDYDSLFTNDSYRPPTGTFSCPR